MKQMYGDFVAGFDAVNEEDTSLQMDDLIDIFVRHQALEE